MQFLDASDNLKLLWLGEKHLEANKVNKSHYEDVDIDATLALTFLAKVTLDYPNDVTGSDLPDGDPSSYTAAMKSADQGNWRKAMQDEWNSLLINENFQAFKSSDNTIPLRPISASDASDEQTSNSGITVPFACKPQKCR